MNSVDLVLAIVLAGFGLRGLWRGFLRESFGLLALFGALAVAFRFAAVAAAAIEPYSTLPLLREGVGFVGVFVATHALVTLTGVVLDRLAGPAFGGLRAVAGAAVGIGKGGALAAFVLLFLHLFPLLPQLEGRLLASRLAPPLIVAAGQVIRFGLTLSPDTTASHT
ncbi:MAG: CvpA family protein [Deltaproteobacteria bacterium]|nr:CvpA family protein [Deltaproteobacteria bacterium]